MKTIEPGCHIVAKRKVPSKIYHNQIIGPVTDVFSNAVRVTTNAGTDIESNWQINFSDWNIDVLFNGDGAIPESVATIK